MDSPDPTIRPQPQPEDLDRSLRPQLLDEFIGQAEARANLRVFIESARQRGQAMDHTLFHGPPGLGKTTLAQIMARELGVGFRQTSGPVLAKAGDLAAILTNLEPRDVLFIDEIHRLNPAVEEILYPALEDFALDLVIGEGPAARTVRIDLQPFTLVGATTRLGLLTTPLRDRFGIPTRLQYYSDAELYEIVIRGARMLGAPAEEAGAREIARRARGTPRIAGRLLRRVVDFALVEGDGRVSQPDRRSGPDPAGGRSSGAGRCRPALPDADRAGLWRRPRGRRNPVCRAVRKPRRAGRGDRAVPAATGPDPAHAARAAADGAGLAASGARRARNRRRTCSGKGKRMSHTFGLRVYYEDTDLAGIVYYANYLRFIERARTEWVRELGIDQVRLKAESGTVFAVRRIEADYLMPARFDDELVVRTETEAVTGARLVLRQTVWRGAGPAV